MGILVDQEIRVIVCAHCGHDEKRLTNLFCANCGEPFYACFHCGSSGNRPSNLFCIDCGRPVSVCPLCGANNRLLHSFCGSCGQSLPGVSKVVPKTIKVEIECAGFWRRFVAYLLDWIILVIIQTPLSFASFFLPYAYYYHFGPIFNVLYTVGFWARKSRTPGKMALGVTIVTEDGLPITLGRSLIRYFGYIVCFLSPFWLGFFWMIWDENKQGWHDKLANTYVIMD